MYDGADAPARDVPASDVEPAPAGRPAVAATYPVAVTSAPLDGSAPEPAPGHDPPPEVVPQRHSVLVYTLSRLAVFAVVVGLLALLGLRSYLLVVVALLVSGAVSLVLLNRQRDAMSSAVAGTFRRINDRIDASARAEDDEPGPS
jgi:hypothetical protein